MDYEGCIHVAETLISRWNEWRLSSPRQQESLLVESQLDALGMDRVVPALVVARGWGWKVRRVWSHCIMG